MAFSDEPERLGTVILAMEFSMLLPSIDDTVFEVLVTWNASSLPFMDTYDFSELPTQPSPLHNISWSFVLVGRISHIPPKLPPPVTLRDLTRNMVNAHSHDNRHRYLRWPRALESKSQRVGHASRTRQLLGGLYKQVVGRLQPLPSLRLRF